MSSNPAVTQGKSQTKSIGTQTPAQALASAKRNRQRKRNEDISGILFKPSVKRIIKDSQAGEKSYTCTKHGLYCLCALINNALLQLCHEVKTLAVKERRKTIGRKEVETAILLVLTGQLKVLCLRDANALIAKEKANKKKQ